MGLISRLAGFPCTVGPIWKPGAFEDLVGDGSGWILRRLRRLHRLIYRTCCRVNGVSLVVQIGGRGLRVSVLSSGVRVGAVAFAVGLSLAGPQAVGVAAADSSDASSVSAGADPGAGPARAARSAAVRSARGARSAAGVSAQTPDADSALGAVRGSASVKPAAAVADRRRSHATLTVGSGAAVRSLVDPAPDVPEVAAAALPSAAAVAVDPARVPARAQRAAAARATVTPVLTGDVVATVGFAVEHFMDTVGLWLRGFPANPITDFLSGALWLVRRSLFPTGNGVGLGGVPEGLDGSDCVAAKDCSGLDLTGADFTRRDLTGVKFIGTTLEDAILAGADMTGAKFIDADLSGARFGLKAKLANADLTGAKLYGAELYGADLSGATLTRATLTRVEFNLPVRGGPGGWPANLSGAKLDGATLNGATLESVNLTGADLSGAHLEEAVLASADLTGAKLIGAKLMNAELSQAQLIGADLSGADLTRAYLWGTKFMNATLANAILDGATLVNANFTGAKGQPIDSRLVNFTYATCPDGQRGRERCSFPPAPSPVAAASRVVSLAPEEAADRVDLKALAQVSALSV